MKQYQCKRAGHIYTGTSNEDPGCPICEQYDTEIGKTIPHYVANPTNAATNTSIATTGIYTHLDTSVEPVVGWLACAKGGDAGKDWRLVEGRNAIGRDANMQISLTGDTAVSRQKHAFVSFEPRQQVFTLLPGDSRGLVYCNGREVTAPIQLNAFDRIELGQTTLVFVPLACDQFRWTESALFNQYKTTNQGDQVSASSSRVAKPKQPLAR